MTKTELQAMTVPELEKLRNQVADELSRRRNQSNIQPGMTVKHRKGLFAKGKVLEIAKSGLRAYVEYKGPYYEVRSYIKVELLEPIGEAAAPKGGTE